ncbi:endonuclease/exonuclease/phosphatase family protein [Allorhizocola rhizosphaerae]|uniref:endonuclease/exonuclease/phosphatase family protein n=1 Tax=Allorhizocola rhizosphaerae TaxID=1872709 RepID=UPI001FE38D48|nr:endonuclease/exonuclease/phosphatase family protein [Allorhizocola rhizosphaerae]
MVLVAAVVTGSTAPPRTIRILQMNLCNSGIAGCYTGRAVQQATALIAAESPDVVALNEVCRDDVAALGEAVGKAGWTVVSAFHPAPDRRTGQATLCRNGQPFGIGLVMRLPRPTQTTTHPGAYPMQDPGDPEERVWLCLAAAGRFTACTTHLAINPAIALAQCRHLLSAVISARPALAAGDFNLRDMRECVPPGYHSRNDEGLQHVVATTGVTLRSGRPIDMAGATDHPALLVAGALTRDTGHD